MLAVSVVTAVHSALVFEREKDTGHGHNKREILLVITIGHHGNGFVVCCVCLGIWMARACRLRVAIRVSRPFVLHVFPLVCS